MSCKGYRRVVEFFSVDIHGIEDFVEVSSLKKVLHCR